MSNNNSKWIDASFLQKVSTQLDKFGVVLVPNFLEHKEIEYLRTDCEVLLDKINSDLLVGSYGCVLEPNLFLEKPCLPGVGALLDYTSVRQSIGLAEQTSALLISEKMQTLANAVLGTKNCRLFNENFIIKPPQHSGSGFGWHRDADGISDKAAANCYVSFWCALDDMHEENGCLVVPSCGGRVTKHKLFETPTISLQVSVGTLVILAHDSWHCSLQNRTDKARRAWMPQFVNVPVYQSHSLNGQQVDENY